VNAELIHVNASDGLRLDGALYAPSSTQTPAVGVDAFLLLHGTGGNFYSSSLFGSVIPRCLQWGAAVLAVNTRGHDLAYAATTAAGRRMFGAAYELVAECRLDLAAWLALLAQRRYKRVAMVGHSLGAVKAVYSLAQESPPIVDCLIAISPPRLSHSHFLRSSQAELFQSELAVAQAHVAEGCGETTMAVRFPLPYLVTAAGYVDKYGPAERYNILNHAERLTVPALFTFGSIEARQNPAFAGSPEALEEVAHVKPNLQVAVITGADHFYTGVQDDLLSRIEFWLRRK
jgi:pimeloyl-ACP methyl ester carboxylesterase